MEKDNCIETQFREFALLPIIIESLDAAGYTHCTPIQAETLPISLAGGDIAGQAQTGTGKTAAFMVATFSRLLTHPEKEGRRKNQPRALILAPTRELAIQICKDGELLGRGTGLRLGLAYGGTGYESQRKAITEGLDILIGTPGRLIDYFKQRVFDLKAADVLVLDEADRMFDLGFIDDIRYLLRRMPDPQQRLNMLFSATLSMRVMELAYEHMNNPKLVKIASTDVTTDNVEQHLFHPATSEKIPLLLGILHQHQPQRSIIFVNTKRNADIVWGFLESNGYRNAVLSGDVPQAKRQRLLQRFEEGEFPILVATDVAARGLHIPGVTHIINFDLPQDAEDYVHRIGRTARAGASGTAISFACEEYAYSLMDIESYIGSKIPVISIQDDHLITPEPRKRRPPKKKFSGGGSRGRDAGGGGRRPRSHPRGQ
ncbi:MAG: ATP-dependent RNA helicase RhlB [Gammaproteobacteria bacterium]|nr:ATP-dependent RNA helicase RhlB [Gammaproteobacteria bacterium]